MKMDKIVLKVGRFGFTEPSKEEEWVAKEIHLMDNKLSELPESPNCPSLIALYLQRNYDLAAIPPSFFNSMSLLQMLDLSDTNIKSLPQSLPKLVSLKKLFLRGCKIFMELPNDVGKLSNLEQLDLDETDIMSLPTDIGKLVKLRLLKVSFYGQIRTFSKRRLQSNMVLYPETLSNLSQLIQLSIEVDPSDKRWADSVEAVVKVVCNLKILRSLSLYLPKVELLDYISVIYPSLLSFRFIVGYHRRRIVSRVPDEAEAEFRKWDKCLKFVNGENIPIQVKEVLKFSTSFFLDRHADTLNLSKFGNESMKMLKFCLLAECNKMETIVDQSETDDPASAENLLESLQYLSVYYMENLERIWKGPIHYGCMSKLKFLALHTCPNLSNIFSLALLQNFVNLEEFILDDCPQVTSLVSHESLKPISDFFLLSLKRLFLLYLPELVSIFNGLVIAPNLERIGFYNCPKVTSLSRRELSSKYLKSIKGESRWWEDIEWIATEWGNPPEHLLQIFSPVNDEEDVMTQFTEDRDVSQGFIHNEGQQSDPCSSVTRIHPPPPTAIVSCEQQEWGFQVSAKTDHSSEKSPKNHSNLDSKRTSKNMSSSNTEAPTSIPSPLPRNRTLISSRSENQKRRDWNTFCQYLRNHKPPITLSTCKHIHVIEFLRYLDQFGKTKVHLASCQFFGHSSPPASCTCPLRQAWGSLDALISRLRKAYEDHGGNSERNPFGARAVRIYLREVRDIQAKARGLSYNKKRKQPEQKVAASPACIKLDATASE